MEETTSNTEYDDVFRTLLNYFPHLAIPLINEFFGTSYNEAKMSPSSTACCKWGKHTITSGEHISRFVETLIGRKL